MNENYAPMALMLADAFRNTPEGPDRNYEPVLEGLRLIYTRNVTLEGERDVCKALLDAGWRLTPPGEPMSVCVLCGNAWYPKVMNRCWHCGGFCTWGKEKGGPPSSWDVHEDGSWTPKPVPEELRKGDKS